MSRREEKKGDSERVNGLAPLNDENDRIFFPETTSPLVCMEENFYQLDYPPA